MTIHHHPADTRLLEFAAGSLDEAQRLIVAAHIEGCPACRRAVNVLEHAGGVLMDDLTPAPLATHALVQVLERTERPAAPSSAAARSLPADLPAMPDVLRQYEVGPWRWSGPGIYWRPVTLPGGSASRAFLLKADPGTRLPHHTHIGTEPRWRDGLRRFADEPRRWSGLTGMLAMLFLCSCTPADVLNVLAKHNGIQVTNSIPYGDGPRRTLDVYKPEDAHSAPIVVFFYGGSWQTGSKEIYRFVATSLASRGFVIVVPDYRVYPDVPFEGFMQDSAQAVAWAKRNATRFGGDPDKLFIMGHSAGAHIAAMLTFDDQWLKADGLLPRRDIAGFIGLAGPYDFLPIKDPVLQKIFSGNDRPETQPITFVRGGEPPVFLGVANSDSLVEPSNTTRLAAKLRANGDHPRVVMYDHVGHLTLVGAFSPFLRFLAPVRNDVAEFIARIAAKPRAAPGRGAS